MLIPRQELLTLSPGRQCLSPLARKSGQVVPAATVIAAPLAYIKVVAVKGSAKAGSVSPSKQGRSG